MVFDLSYLIVQYTTGLQILKVRDAIALFLCGTLGTKGFFSVLLFHPLLLAGLAFRDTVDASPILPTCFIHCPFSGLALTYPFSGHQLFLVSTLTNSLEEEKECGCRHETVPDASHGSTETGKAEKMSSGESRASLVSFQIPISSL